MKTTALLLVSGIALAGCGQSNKNSANASAANNVHAANAQAGGSDVQNAAAPGAATAPAAAAAGSVTPDQFRAMLQRDGARQTVQKLDADENSPVLGQVYDGIATGNDQWLAVVPLLSTGTDASTTEGLRDVLVDALPRNAAGVLRAIGDRQTSEFFKEGSCFPPEDATGQAARDYIATATRAVEAVTDPALKAAKTQCLANLRQAPA
jgi:hypothetical protein